MSIALDNWRLIAHKTDGPRAILKLRCTCKTLKSTLRSLHYVRLRVWCGRKLRWINKYYAHYVPFGHEDIAKRMSTLWLRQTGVPCAKKYLLVTLLNVFEALDCIYSDMERKCRFHIGICEKSPLRYINESIERIKGELTKVAISSNPNNGVGFAFGYSLPIIFRTDDFTITTALNDTILRKIEDHNRNVRCFYNKEITLVNHWRKKLDKVEKHHAKIMVKYDAVYGKITGYKNGEPMVKNLLEEQ